MRRLGLALCLLLGLVSGAAGQGLQVPVASAFLNATYTNATTTFSSVPGLAFPVAVGANYYIECMVVWQGSASTTGAKYQFTGPASPSAVVAGAAFGITATTMANAGAVAFSSAIANPGTITTATNFMDVVRLSLINGATSGTVQLQAAANGAGTLTIQPGSVCTLLSVR